MTLNRSLFICFISVVLCCMPCLFGSSAIAAPTLLLQLVDSVGGTPAPGSNIIDAGDMVFVEIYLKQTVATAEVDLLTDGLTSFGFTFDASAIGEVTSFDFAAGSGLDSSFATAAGFDEDFQARPTALPATVANVYGISNSTAGDGNTYAVDPMDGTAELLLGTAKIAIKSPATSGFLSIGDPSSLFAETVFGNNTRADAFIFPGGQMHNLSFTAVPEPSSFFYLGLIGVAVVVRKRLLGCLHFR